ncbi:hypothetical protein JWG44_16870 [Leptospira sp. 201903071]|uniref:hypothetical protein n=1 Tax=Leptospira ainazelensis TaxID=2810034 RepID=UPI0019622B95|nr:hypothetical protein [Leptospira ainazelensis]MBM9501930.1 hypothetical protein [Leptospira ainazelensis]
MKYFHKFNFATLFASITLSICSLRALVPLVLDNGSFAYPTIYLTFFMGVCLSLWGLIKACLTQKNEPSYFISKILIVNLTVSFLWILPELFSEDRSLAVKFIYSGLFPCSVLAFLDVKEKNIIRILGLIAILISFSIAWDSYEMNLLPYPGGYIKAYNRQLIIRPDTLDFFGSTKGIFRSGGLLGIRPHESGSLLAMILILFCGLGIRNRKLVPIEFFVAFLSAVGLFLSQSASNIGAAAVGGVFLVIFFRDFFLQRNHILVFISGFIGFFFFFSDRILNNAILFFSNMMNRFSLNYVGWKGMTRIGDSGDPFMDLMDLVFDFCTIVGRCKVPHSEIDLLNIFMEYGLFYFVLFVLLLLYPVIYFVFLKKKNDISIPYVAAIFVGFVSLWHYATVLRTSNIFIFFSIYSLFLRKMYSNVEFRNRPEA